MNALTLLVMNANEFGARVKQARNARGFNQETVAARAGVSRSLISQWENGTGKEVYASNLHAVAKVLGVTIDWLLEGDRHARATVSASSDAQPLLDAWEHLTDRQRKELIEQAAALAAHNRELLAELSSK